MPGESHQTSHETDADTIMALLQVLLDPPEDCEPDSTTLDDLDIDDDGVLDLWQAVCAEFDERTLGSEIDRDLLDPAMTVAAATVAMAAELASGVHHGL